MYKKKNLLALASMIVVLGVPALDAGKKREKAATGEGEIGMAKGNFRELRAKMSPASQTRLHPSPDFTVLATTFL